MTEVNWDELPLSEFWKYLYLTDRDNGTHKMNIWSKK